MKQLYYLGWYMDVDGNEYSFKVPKTRSLFPVDEIKEHLPRHSEVLEFCVVDQDGNWVDH